MGYVCFEKLVVFSFLMVFFMSGLEGCLKIFLWIKGVKEVFKFGWLGFSMMSLYLLSRWWVRLKVILLYFVFFLRVVLKRFVSF